MRSYELHEFVTNLVTDEWTEADEDVATAILADNEAFGALCHRLNDASDGERGRIQSAWAELMAGLSDDELDFLAERADNPAAFLASKVGT